MTAFTVSVAVPRPWASSCGRSRARAPSRRGNGSPRSRPALGERAPVVGESLDGSAAGVVVRAHRDRWVEPLVRRRDRRGRVARRDGLVRDRRRLCDRRVDGDGPRRRPRVRRAVPRRPRAAAGRPRERRDHLRCGRPSPPRRRSRRRRDDRARRRGGSRSPSRRSAPSATRGSSPRSSASASSRSAEPRSSATPRRSPSVWTGSS